MNKAVNTNEISGFSLKVKTAYSNTFIGTLEYPKVINGERKSLNSETFSLNQIVFKDQDIRSFNIKPGQFLKVQLAYIDNDNITGLSLLSSSPGVYIPVQVEQKILILLESSSLESFSSSSSWRRG